MRIIYTLEFFFDHSFIRSRCSTKTNCCTFRTSLSNTDIIRSRALPLPLFGRQQTGECLFSGCHVDVAPNPNKIARMGEASSKLRVSEDKKKIGRTEPMTAEGNKERIARTVQVRYGTVRQVGPAATRSKRFYCRLIRHTRGLFLSCPPAHLLPPPPCMLGIGSGSSCSLYCRAPLATTLQTKGYNKDSTIQIEGVEKLFADIGKATYVKICRARSPTTPKLSEESCCFCCFSRKKW